MVHPFHPLHGQEFDLVCYKHTWGEHRVFFQDADDCQRSLPASWTSVVPPDPFVAVAAGRTPFRLAELLALVTLLRQLERSPPGSRDPSQGKV